MNDDIFYFYCLGLLFLFMFWIYAYRGYQVERARTKAERIGENIRRAGVRGRIDARKLIRERMELARIKRELFDESLLGDGLTLGPGGEVEVDFTPWKSPRYIHSIYIADKKGDLIKSPNIGLIFWNEREDTWDCIDEADASLYYIKEEIDGFIFFNGSSQPITIAEMLVRDGENEGVRSYELEVSRGVG